MENGINSDSGYRSGVAERGGVTGGSVKTHHTGSFSDAEIVFGIVGATGSDMGLVELALTDALHTVKYLTERIRLSTLIEEHYNVQSPSSEYERIKQAMDRGNDLRKFGNDSVALLGVVEIRRRREQHWLANKSQLPDGTEGDAYLRFPVPRRAYILHSLKHPSEISTLRQIYGDSFYVISTYTARHSRKSSLKKRIGESEMESKKIDRRDKKADLLMKRDYIENDVASGQNVRDAFPLADLFVQTDNEEECKDSIKRFVRMIFGDTQETPTIDEYCMFHAKGAALRSGDLGRQVGATIATAGGDILSHGTNEAPKAHGGQFWPGDEVDGRGVKQKADISDGRKREIFVDLLQRLLNGNQISGIDESGIEVLAEQVFSDKRPKWMKGAEILELIGFYRSVHGETAAIINAARLGISIKGHNLYVTAFPCHECARHILAAGIETVYYVEPYPKSLAGKHYPESIAIDDAPKKSQILFQQFVGIAPRIYMRFFESLERKNKDGTVIRWIPETAQMRYHSHWLAYTDKEAVYCSQFVKTLSKDLGKDGSDDQSTPEETS